MACRGQWSLSLKLTRWDTQLKSYVVCFTFLAQKDNEATLQAKALQSKVAADSRRRLIKGLGGKSREEVRAGGLVTKFII